MMKKNLLVRTVSVVMGIAVVAAGICMPEGRGNTVRAEGEKDIVDTSGWQDSVVIDFGVRKEAYSEDKGDRSDLALDKHIQLKQDAVKQAFGNIDVAPQIEGRGNWLYDNTTIQDVYKDVPGTNQNVSVKQKMGFDRVLPAGVIAVTDKVSVGEYFRDWLFSPDGEAYDFKIDLPVGQYYVVIYTGNKTKGHDNTTFVRFNDEAFEVDGTEYDVAYDQTSRDGKQFYGTSNNNDKSETELVYVVDVKDNGMGYGTLKATMFDDTLDDDAYGSSHNITVGSVLNPVTDDEGNVNTYGIETFDLYDGTADEIPEDDIADKVVTARLNGIEIAPVVTPVNATKIEGNGAMVIEMGEEETVSIDSGDEYVTDRIMYVSADASIAEVNRYSGKVNAKNIGKTKIYAYNTCLGQSVGIECEVIPEKKVSLDRDSIELKVDGDGEALLSTLTAEFNEADSDVIEWDVSEKGIVTLGTPEFEAGELSKSKVTVKAVETGIVTVTATRTDSHNKVAECRIYVTRDVKEIRIVDKDGKEYSDDDVISIVEGGTVKIGSVVIPANASDTGVTYSSENRNIAKVLADKDGATITAVAPGETIIKIVSNNNSSITAKVKVVVTAKPVPSAGPQPDSQPSPQPDSQPSPQPDSQPSPQPVSQPTQPPQSDAGTSATVNAGSQQEKDTDPARSAIKLSGRASTVLKVKKSVSFKINVSGTSVAKVTCKIKSGKKYIKLSASKKTVKVTAKKRGTAKIVITVKGGNGSSVRFTRTIRIR